MSRVFFVDRDLGRHIFPDALEDAGLADSPRHPHSAPTGTANNPSPNAVV